MATTAAADGIAEECNNKLIVVHCIALPQKMTKKNDQSHSSRVLRRRSINRRVMMMLHHKMLDKSRKCVELKLFYAPALHFIARRGGGSTKSLMKLMDEV